MCSTTNSLLTVRRRAKVLVCSAADLSSQGRWTRRVSTMRFLATRNFRTCPSSKVRLVPSNGQHSFTGLDKPESTSILTFFFVPCLRMHSIQKPCRFISPSSVTVLFFTEQHRVQSSFFQNLPLTLTVAAADLEKQKDIAGATCHRVSPLVFPSLLKKKVLVTYRSTSHRHWLGGLADAVKTSCRWARYVTKALTNIFAHSLALASSGVHQRWDFAAFCATPCECRQRTTAKPPASTLYC